MPQSAKAHGCDCAECREAQRRARKQAQFKRSSGISQTIEAGPARSYVKSLMKAGLSIPDIATATGLSDRFLQYLVNGNYTTVSTTTHEAIKSVTLQEVPTPIGTVRRLQALTAQGWSSRRIAAGSGVSRKEVLRVLDGENVPKLNVRRRIQAVYDELKDENPLLVERADNVARTKAKAASHKWLAPHAWEESELGIDDPRAKPFKQTLKQRHEEMFSEMDYLHSFGVVWDDAVARLSPGWSPDSMVRRSYRLGYADVVRKFRRETV